MNRIRWTICCVVILHLFACRLTLAQTKPPITALAFSPSGNTLVVGSQAGVSVRRWPSGKETRTIPWAFANIGDIAFSPSGKSLAIVGGDPAERGAVEIKRWPDGERVALFEKHEDTVKAAVWLSETQLATASLDHTIAIWDVERGVLLKRLTGHSRGVTSLGFLKEKQLLVSGGLDQNLRVWNVETGAIVRTLNNHKREIHDVAVRPAHEGLPMIASVSEDRTMRLWQPSIGRMVRFAQLKAAPLSVAWSPDGTRVAVACDDGALRIIDPDTVDVVCSGPTLRGLAFTIACRPNQAQFAVGGSDGAIVTTKATAGSPAD